MSQEAVADNRAAEASPVVAMKEDLKLAALLGGMGALATAALFPYLMVVMPQVLAKLPATVPLSLVIVAQCLQAAILLTLLSFAGLRMGHRAGLGAPWLRSALFGRARAPQRWLAAIVLGAAAGLLIVAADSLFAPHMPIPLVENAPVAARASAAVGLLASFYGGIAEELQLRLFLMTLLVWLLSALARGRPRAAQFWIAIVIAALLFGIGHLPAAAAIWPLDALVVTRIILLNTLGGLVFGWLYWKQGLESAMIAHFSTDLVLHVLAPLVVG